MAVPAVPLPPALQETKEMKTMKRARAKVFCDVAYTILLGPRSVCVLEWVRLARPCAG